MKLGKMYPREWGSVNGLPSIVWQRAGVPALGEMATVTETRVYESEEARLIAFYGPVKLFAKDGSLAGVFYCKPSTRRGAVMSITILPKQHPAHLRTCVRVTGADFNKAYARVVKTILEAYRLPVDGEMHAAMLATSSLFLKKNRLKLIEVRYETAVEDQDAAPVQ